MEVIIRPDAAAAVGPGRPVDCRAHSPTPRDRAGVCHRAHDGTYEQLINDSGGIDLQLLGIGEAGHIGFNEPLSAIMSRTRDKCLTPTTRRQIAAMFGGDPE